MGPLPSTSLYLHDGYDRSARRVVQPCRVTRQDGSRAWIDAEVELQGIIRGSIVTVFVERRKAFLQQLARVEQVLPSPPGRSRLLLDRIGELVDADQRGGCRTSCDHLGLLATLAGETRCRVVDLSTSGLGVECREEKPLRATVDLELQLAADVSRGPVEIRSARVLPSGRIRHGLRAVPARSGSSLVPTLRRLFLVAIQSRLEALTKSP